MANPKLIISSKNLSHALRRACDHPITFTQQTRTLFHIEDTLVGGEAQNWRDLTINEQVRWTLIRVLEAIAEQPVTVEFHSEDRVTVHSIIV